MNKVTDFLKQITIDKKNQGIQYAIENLRDFIKKNSLIAELTQFLNFVGINDPLKKVYSNF